MDYIAFSCRLAELINKYQERQENRQRSLDEKYGDEVGYEDFPDYDEDRADDDAAAANDLGLLLSDLTELIKENEGPK